MKGAIAEPCVATNNAPNNAIVIIIGANQYFLRIRRKAQNSTMKLPINDSSELLPHGRRSALRLTLYPIAAGTRIGRQAQRPLSQQPHDKRHRRDNKKEEEHQDDRIYHLRQE